MSKLLKAMSRIKNIAETLEEGDPDKQEMLDVEGDYTPLMEWAIRKRAEALAFEAASKDLSKTYSDRATRFKKKADSMKDICGILMECAQETSFKGVSGTVSKRSLPDKVNITDEQRIPDKFFVETRTLDKKALNKAVQSGENISGVEVVSGGESVTVRVK